MSEETPLELRENRDALAKENKKLQKQHDAAQQELRELKAASAFQEAGLSPQLAELFVASAPEAEINVESAVEFADRYGVTTASTPTEEEPTEEAPETEGLEQFSRAGSQGGGGSVAADRKLLTKQDFLRLQVEDPASAAQALSEGRVLLRGDNPYGTGVTTVPGENPFVAEHQVSDE